MNLLTKLVYQSLLSEKEVTEDDFKNFLKEASDDYYIGEPSITDEEFDTFRNIFKNKFEYDCIQIGSNKSLSKGFAKAQHTLAMGSLEEFSTAKGDVVGEIKKWAKKYAEKDEYCTSEKLDGLSISIEFKEGKLIQALTRGDGNEGDDVTSNVLKIARFPNELPIPFTGFIRSEIALKKSVRSEFFPHYANERNGAGGLLKRLDGAGSEHLDVYSFKCESSEYKFDTEYESMLFIKDILKLNTPRFYKTNLETMIALHKRYENEARDKLDYLLDGLVVNINCKINQEKITDNHLLPEYARKFKFASEKAITELVLVRNQVGRTGAITPLAILEPVACGGTIISKASLHNYDEIKRLGIKIGDFVEIIRSKDVIPKIIGVSRKGEFEVDIEAPTECPVCSTPVSKEDTVIYCPNDFCSAKVSRGLIHWLNILNIKNMGEKIVDGLIEAEKLQNISDFYKLQVQDIANLDGQGVKNATKILNEIHTRKELTVAELLAGLNIRNLSVKRAEILEDQFGDIENIINIKSQDIVNLDGFEEKLATFIVSGLKSKKNLIREILKYVSIKRKIEGVLSNKSFCFSGFRDNDLELQIKKKGGRIAEGVSKKLDYLIVKNKIGTTSKLDKARQYGINIIDPHDLEGLLQNTLF